MNLMIPDNDTDFDAMVLRAKNLASAMHKKGDQRDYADFALLKAGIEGLQRRRPDEAVSALLVELAAVLDAINCKNHPIIAV